MDKYAKWDALVADLMYCLISAEEKYKYFYVLNVDPDNEYDLLYFRIASLANNLVKTCKLYCSAPNWLTLLWFKRKEPKAKKFPHHEKKYMTNINCHLCPPIERKDLIKDLAARHDIPSEEIIKIYREYYGR